MIIYGKQLFYHYLNQHPKKIKEIYLAKELDKKSFSQLLKLGLKINKLDPIKAQAMAHGGNHQGFLALVDDFVYTPFAQVKKAQFLAVLYELSDVGNIGSIARTAKALGVDALVVVAKSLAIEGVLRASSAAALDLPICLMADGKSLINELAHAGFLTLASDALGEEYFGEDSQSQSIQSKEPKYALFLGSEAQGLPGAIKRAAHKRIGIKMQGFDSLNVGVAFAILSDRIKRPEGLK